MKSDGCIISTTDKNYIGDYQLDVDSINFYNKPITKEEILKIWRRSLYPRVKLKLDASNYDDYMELLKSKNNLKSRCQ